MNNNSYTVAEAIDLFRPEFAERDAIRTELFTLKHNSETYFATIPHDIFGIIVDFVPTLRQSYNTQQYEHLLDKYNEFAKNYKQPIYVRNFAAYDRSTIFAKLISNAQLCSGIPTVGLFSTSIYLGKDYCVSHRNIEQQIDREWWVGYRVSPGKDMWLLPCRILIIRYHRRLDNNTKIIANHLAIDLQNLKNVVMLHTVGCNYDFNKLYDDYGELIDTGLPYYVLRFSTYTPEPAVFYPK